MPPLPPPDRRRLASLRKLLASAVAEEVAQGLHLLDTLDDPLLLAAVGEGLAVRLAEFPRPRPDDVYDTEPAEPIGFIEAIHVGAEPEAYTRTRDAWIGWHVRAQHRATVALHVARTLGLLDGLRRLVVVGPVWDLTPLRGLPDLEELWIEDGMLLDSLEGLSGLSSLRMLHVRNPLRVKDLGDLQDLPSLAALFLVPCPLLRDIDGLGGLPQLRALEMAGTDALTDLAFLRHVPDLERLSLRDARNVTDWTPLARARELRALDLASCRSVPGIGSLAGLPGLEELDLSGTDVASLAPFRVLPALRILRLRACRDLVDVRDLLELPLLEELDLRTCWKLPGRYQNRLTMEHLPGVRAFFRDPRARLATICAPLLAAERDDEKLDALVLRDVLRSLGEETVVGGTLVPFLRAWARERLAGSETAPLPPDPFEGLPDADELPF